MSARKQGKADIDDDDGNAEDSGERKSWRKWRGGMEADICNYVDGGGTFVVGRDSGLL